MANNKKTPRPYGRQSKDKTIKSLSLDADVAKWVGEEAKRRGVKDSSLVNELLKKLMLLALISALVRWLALGADPLTASSQESKLERPSSHEHDTKRNQHCHR